MRMLQHIVIIQELQIIIVSHINTVGRDRQTFRQSLIYISTPSPIAGSTALRSHSTLRFGISKLLDLKTVVSELIVYVSTVELAALSVRDI